MSSNTRQSTDGGVTFLVSIQPLATEDCEPPAPSDRASTLLVFSESSKQEGRDKGQAYRLAFWHKMDELDERETVTDPRSDSTVTEIKQWMAPAKLNLYVDWDTFTSVEYYGQQSREDPVEIPDKAYGELLQNLTSG